jgi:hypothetical protein
MASDWEGDWHTDYGNLTIEVYGTTLEGEYESRGGTLRGVVNGDVATGTWRQFYTERPGIKTGWFRIELDDDSGFSGQWNYGDTIGPPWDGTWEGTKKD